MYMYVYIFAGQNAAACISVQLEIAKFYILTLERHGSGPYHPLDSEILVEQVPGKDYYPPSLAELSNICGLDIRFPDGIHIIFSTAVELKKRWQHLTIPRPSTPATSDHSLTQCAGIHITFPDLVRR